MQTDGPDPSVARRAAYYALAIDLGLCSVGEAMEWADAAVMRERQPDALLLDLSLATKSSRQDVTRLLRDLSDGASSENVALAIIGRLSREHEEGVRPLQSTVDCLRQLSWGGSLPPDVAAEAESHRGSYILATEVEEMDYEMMRSALEAWLREFEPYERALLSFDEPSR